MSFMRQHFETYACEAAQLQRWLSESGNWYCTSQPKSWLLETAGSCVGVKQPGPPSPWPTRTPGMIMACK